MTDSEAEAMTLEMLELESREIALRKRYFKEFRKVLPAMTVAKFFQLEHRIDLLTEMKVEAALPPIGQSPDAPQETK